MKRAPDATCPVCRHLVSRHARLTTRSGRGHCLDCPCVEFFEEGGSGEHQAVKQMRAKFESIAENTLPLAEALNSKIDELAETVSSHPPAPDSDPNLVPDTEPEKKP